MSLNLDGFEIRPTFVHKLLSNPRTATPLTGTEVELSKHIDLLHSIQDEIEMNLSSFLHRNSPYVSLRDQLFFLLDSYEQDMLNLAVETLDAAYENRIKLNAAGLVKIMQEDSEYSVMPSLMVSLLGDETEETEFDSYHPQPPQPKKSALNLDAMRDFK